MKDVRQPRRFRARVRVLAILIVTAIPWILITAWWGK